MKKLLLALSIAFQFKKIEATELHVENVIVTFPCQANKPDTLSSTVAQYSCTASKMNFQFIITKDKIERTYDQFVKEVADSTHSKIVSVETQKINGKEVKYLILEYSQDKTSYLSESILYISNSAAFRFTATRDKENTRRTETQIFLNSIILVK